MWMPLRSAAAQPSKLLKRRRRGRRQRCWWWWRWRRHRHRKHRHSVKLSRAEPGRAGPGRAKPDFIVTQQSMANQTQLVYYSYCGGCLLLNMVIWSMTSSQKRKKTATNKHINTHWKWKKTNVFVYIRPLCVQLLIFLHLRKEKRTQRLQNKSQ